MSDRETANTMERHPQQLLASPELTSHTSSSPLLPQASTTTDTPCCNCIAERLGNTLPQTFISPNSYRRYPMDDDPPPYASLMGPSSPDHQHMTWSYVFPTPPYEDTGGGTESRAIARPLVSIPLTSYGIYKIEPPRYAPPLQRQHPRLLPEAGPVVKSSGGTARKYGAILIAATVIIFLMALSLVVRFVTEKSLWRG